jgi:hypothetical protein
MPTSSPKNDKHPQESHYDISKTDGSNRCRDTSGDSSPRSRNPFHPRQTRKRFRRHLRSTGPEQGSLSLNWDSITQERQRIRTAFLDPAAAK